MEIIPHGRTRRNLRLTTFSFFNEQDCTVIINGTEKITVFGGFGLQLQYNIPVFSFVIVEPDITFFWIGGQ